MINKKNWLLFCLLRFLSILFFNKKRTHFAHFLNALLSVCHTERFSWALDVRNRAIFHDPLSWVLLMAIFVWLLWIMATFHTFFGLWFEINAQNYRKECNHFFRLFFNLISQLAVAFRNVLSPWSILHQHINWH